MIIEYLRTLYEEPYVLLVNTLGVLTLVLFIVLPNKKKTKSRFLLPFLFIALVTFYEDFSVYLLYNKNLNQFFHELISDTPFQGWNLWSYNLFNYQISKVLLLVYLRNQIQTPNRKKLVLIFLGGFVLTCALLMVFKLEPLYGFQTIIYFLGNTLLILASGLYFLDLISNPKFLNINPLRNWEFWSVTVILFQSAVVFLADIAYPYLAMNNESLYILFSQVSQALYVLLLAIMAGSLSSGIKRFSL